MNWDTKIYEILEKNNIESYADVADENANKENGFVVFTHVDNIVFEYLDICQRVDVIVSLVFQSTTRQTTQSLMRKSINELWRNGLLVRVDRCEWYHDYDNDIRITAVTAILRSQVTTVKNNNFYCDNVNWQTEIVKTFQHINVEAWPDFAPEDVNNNIGYVVWRQSDELVTEFLDSQSMSQIEIELDFRAYSRAQVQSIKNKVMNALQSRRQLIVADNAEWYVDDTATNKPIRGVIVTALIPSTLAVQPIIDYTGSFSTSFSSDFDVHRQLQEAA